MTSHSEVEKLRKLKDDLIFIDPITIEKACSFNECIKKFTIIGHEKITKYPKWKKGEPVIFLQTYHECNECHRKYRSKKDRSETIGSYHSVIAGNPIEEIK